MLTLTKLIERKGIVVEGLFGLSIFFWIFLTLSIVKPHIFPTIQRVTYEAIFSQSIIYSLTVDSVVIIILACSSIILGSLQIRHSLVLTLPYIILSVTAISISNETMLHYLGVSIIPSIALLSLIHLKKDNFKYMPRFCWKNVLLFFLLYWAAVEILSIGRWTNYLVYGGNIFDNDEFFLANISSQLFYVTALLVPFFVIILSFGFLIKPNFDALSDLLLKKFRSFKKLDFNQESILQKNVSIIIILIAVAFSLVIPSLLLLENVNPANQVLGVDIPFYHEWLDESFDKPIGQVLKNAWTANNSDRPLTLIIIHSIAKLNHNDLESTLQYLPILLSPLLVLSAFMFMRIENNRFLTSITMLLAVFSFQIMVGIYSAFYSNWLAFCSMLICMSFFLMAWKKRSVLLYFTFFLLFMTTYFMHVFTWIYLVVVITIFLIITVLAEHKSSISKNPLKQNLFVFSLIIVGVVIFDLFRGSLIGGVGGISLVTDVAAANYPFYGSSGVALSNLAERWTNLSYNFSVQYGGLLANSILFFLSILWLLKSKYSNTFDRLIIASLFAASTVMLFSDHSIQSRLIYNMPVFISAGLFFKYLPRGKIPIIIILSFIFLFIVNYVLRGMSNLHFVAPS